MLDTNTKRRIDTARDILVGKVPDPKSQVEQITIALIYKFMDDMDAEAEELGGKRKFFTGDFIRYGWAKLMSAGIGGHELIGLYGEGIASMPQNPGIPLLFRDIFKNAYLPYRDPETLKSFLKIIDEFSYDHSERLGDAYEYLLSILGSQGDAGQFRTPRHIIDFMVDILDPKKNETMADPACGTAGFLISAYKHVLKHNSKDYQPKPAHQPDAEKGLPLELLTLESPLHYKGDLLTPDERKKLAGNIKGYDISPDMVRMSLVNLYLHGFNDPHIFEYDTLTSEERWDQSFDVIFANPPFMSPKGGIKPHKRFSIQAKRSEVLFVDYISEHLTPSGRAGIIVPEGIIFQSQTAYKALRKMLVDTSLVAVISLPAGVFQPYSGVKTSILILDKSLAKHSDSIAFFKIDNDGFGLGAQRRAVAGEQLTSVLAGMKDFAKYLNRDTQDLQDKSKKFGLLMLDELISLGTALIVPKEKIALNGDYNLSGERYSDQTRQLQASWPTVSLGEICTFMTGGTPTSTVAEYYENGTVPWLVSGDIHGVEIWNCKKRITQKAVENSNARVLPKDSILIALNGQGKTRGTVALLRMEGATCNQSLVAITPSQPTSTLVEFIFLVLRSMYADIRALTGDTERSGLNMPILKSIQIPLPPLDMQKEIVAEIEGYQKVINGARAVLDNYRPHISIRPDWPMIPIIEVCTVNPRKSEINDMNENIIVSFVPMADLNENKICFQPKDTKKLAEVTSSYTYFRDDDVLLAKVTPCFENGKAGIARNLVNGIGFGSSEFYVLRPEGRILPEWVYISITTSAFRDIAKAQMTGTGGLQRVPRAIVENYQIPVPSLEIQQTIIAEIEAEQALVTANRELITRFEKKIQATLARVWGEGKKSVGEA